MKSPISPAVPADDPHAPLETALIDEFLRSRGTDRRGLRDLPDEQATRLMTAAAAYASVRLTEVESRALFVHEIHGAAGT